MRMKYESKIISVVDIFSCILWDCSPSSPVKLPGKKTPWIPTINICIHLECIICSIWIMHLYSVIFLLHSNLDQVYEGIRTNSRHSICSLSYYSNQLMFRMIGLELNKNLHICKCSLEWLIGHKHHSKETLVSLMTSPFSCVSFFSLHDFSKSCVGELHHS